MRKLGLSVALGVALFGASLFVPSNEANAQVASEQVEAGVKGTVGLGLIGAELGLVLPTAFGLSETWSLITFPVIGAAGGALAGYYLIDSNDQDVAAVSVLAGGVMLLIPALVMAVSFSSYDPDDEVDVDTGTGALRYGKEGWRMTMPSLAVVPNERGAEVHVGLVSGKF